jgi:hypothetical protein
MLAICLQQQQQQQERRNLVTGWMPAERNQPLQH